MKGIREAQHLTIVRTYELDEKRVVAALCCLLGIKPPLELEEEPCCFDAGNGEQHGSGDPQPTDANRSGRGHHNDSR